MSGFFLTLYLIHIQAYAQSTKSLNNPYPTSLEERKAAVSQKTKLRQVSIFKDYPIRNVGPTVMGGRVVDLDVNPDNQQIFYVAYASGGVFKTENNGHSFEPVFDNQARMTIGDIAISPAKPEVVWIGTGENNSSRSSYAGYGIYKTENAGKDWIHCGLENTQHIGRIICHPQNPDIVWVASIGALYSHNPERGVYKTTDGGKSWTKTLFINDSTGVIDLIINPKNPDQLWAAAWERDRDAWDFKENGPGSGLYASEDGGQTWKKTTQGLPASKHMGRIGLDICLTKPETLYLIVDNQEEIRKEIKNTKKLPFTFKDFENMPSSDFLAKKDKDLDTFLTAKGFPKKYNAARIKRDIQAGKYTPKALTTYFANANDDLFNTSIKGAEIYRSDDSGKSWKKVNSYALDRVFNTYGYYFGQIRVNPQNPEQIYIFGVPFLRSDNGGKTYKIVVDKLFGGSIHSDHHALWINPKNPSHIINGNDGGLYVSYDKGEQFLHLNNIPVGQFYTVAVDNQKPYHIYGGLQDNGVFRGSSQGKPNNGTTWERLWGGDGMYVQVHPENSNLIYTGLQFGNYWRIENKRPTRITPRHELGEDPLRFNWRTPLIMSKHNPDILYFGAQRLYRSLDRGDTWVAISDDLTKNLPQGNVPYSTIASFAESPLDFSLLYVGTDDGNVQVSKDGGASWNMISTNLPPNRWVSSIFPSTHDLGTVYITMNGYRFDELKTFVYKSTDFGKNWMQITGNLPDEAVNIIIQDPVEPALLYLGTDEGAYISLDDGANWNLLTGDFPNVATYDLIIHPRENELVLATHGRSVYVMDVKPLQKLVKQGLNQPVYIFKVADMRFSEWWATDRPAYLPKNDPELDILYMVNQENGKTVEIQVSDEQGNQITNLSAKAEKGFHHHKWNLRDMNGNLIKPGKYTIVIQQGKDSAQVSWQLKPSK